MFKKWIIKLKGKRSAMTAILIIAVFILSNMQILAFSTTGNQDGGELKYTLLGNMEDTKINKVSYGVKDELLCLKIDYKASADKNIIAEIPGEKNNSYYVEQNGLIRKDLNSYEIDIPLMKFKGSKMLNLFLTKELTTDTLQQAIEGKKLDGIQISLDEFITETADSTAIAGSSDISKDNQKIYQTIQKKDGFEMEYAGLIERKGVSEIILEYKSNTPGYIIIQGTQQENNFVTIDSVSPGENILNESVRDDFLSSLTTLNVLEVDSMKNTANACRGYITLKDVKPVEDSPENYSNTSVKGKLLITKRPQPANFNMGSKTAIPKYDENAQNPFGVDLRSTDLSSMKIDKDSLKDLMHADFDDKTKFPSKLPKGFNPADIMKIGKNPGLGLNNLHKNGITGKGIGIAIIDQNLLVDHIEYKNQLRCYEEMHWPKDAIESSMHGAAVASIAVGKSVGVAPDADLYYIAEQHGIFANGEFNWDFKPLAKAIDRVIEINSTLPANKKIRVISISVGWSPEQPGYKEVTEAVQKANEQGIFVVDTSMDQNKFSFMGLGRDAMSDPDKVSSYKEGQFWKSYLNNVSNMNKNGILVPMDARTTASPTGNKDYVHYDNGGLSWSVPYIAGLYALACQVDSHITPEIFWKTAAKTGSPLIVKKDEKEYALGNIVNPEKLIQSL